jgi:hypothetical protein
MRHEDGVGPVPLRCCRPGRRSQGTDHPVPQCGPSGPMVRTTGPVVRTTGPVVRTACPIVRTIRSHGTDYWFHGEDRLFHGVDRPVSWHGLPVLTGADRGSQGAACRSHGTDGPHLRRAAKFIALRPQPRSGDISNRANWRWESGSRNSKYRRSAACAAASLAWCSMFLGL